MPYSWAESSGRRGVRCAIICAMRQFISAHKLRILAAVIGLLLVGLALDLKFHGLAWRLFYSVTGEEAPANQLYGFVHYVGNLTRRQPVVSTTIPINYSSVNPLG